MTFIWEGDLLVCCCRHQPEFVRFFVTVEHRGTRHGQGWQQTMNQSQPTRGYVLLIQSECLDTVTSRSRHGTSEAWVSQKHAQSIYFNRFYDYCGFTSKLGRLNGQIPQGSHWYKIYVCLSCLNLKPRTFPLLSARRIWVKSKLLSLPSALSFLLNFRLWTFVGLPVDRIRWMFKVCVLS